jgi:hypothetical protein
MCLEFEFVFFWRYNFGAKAAHKMLVKLTPGLSMSILQVYSLALIAFNGTATFKKCKQLFEYQH